MGAVAGCRAPPPPATCAVKISSKYFYRRGGKYFLSTRYFRQEFFGHIGDTPAVSMGPDAGSMDQTNGEEMLRKQSGNVSSEIKYVSCKSLSSNLHIAEQDSKQNVSPVEVQGSQTHYCNHGHVQYQLQSSEKQEEKSGFRRYGGKKWKKID